MANHLETLLRQYHEWQDCIVRCNVRVGKLERGGYAGELDVVVYDPKSEEVIHYEPSLDGDSWIYREERYKKKFKQGRTYLKEVFPWLPAGVRLRQIAIFNNVPDHRKEFAGAAAIGIDELVKVMKDKIKERSYVGVNAIPEQYDLLRTIQLVVCGYYTDPL
jgi:hypothetical protein